MRILLVEDDHVLGGAIRDHIAATGHGVDWMLRVDGAKAASSAVTYELVLLDMNLPDGRGLDLLRRLRASGNAVPVIITTAQDQIAVRTAGLDAGGDDCLVKPFDLSEMTARVAAVARRYSGNPAPLARVGDAEVNLATKSAMLSGVSVALTQREWAVLERLMSWRNAIVSKAEIEDTLYAFGSEIESNAVEVYVSRLRKKLGRDAVLTMRGLGYQAGR